MKLSNPFLLVKPRSIETVTPGKIIDTTATAVKVIAMHVEELHQGAIILAKGNDCDLAPWDAWTNETCLAALKAKLESGVVEFYRG